MGITLFFLSGHVCSIHVDSELGAVRTSGRKDVNRCAVDSGYFYDELAWKKRYGYVAGSHMCLLDFHGTKLQNKEIQRYEYI